MGSNDSLSIYLTILLKRWKLIVLLMIAGVVATVARIETQPNVYTAMSRVRITAPEPGEVAIYTPLGRSDARKEVEYVKNDFVEIVTGLDTAWRTSYALNREVDGSFIYSAVKVDYTPDSDFVSIIARAGTPDLAQRLANTHTDASLAYFGEIRAKSISGIRKFLSEEMARTQKDMDDANTELQSFRNKHSIGAIDDEIGSYRNLVSALRTERDLVLGRGDTTTAQRFDGIINEREAKLKSLIALTVDYRSLTSRVRQLEDSIGLLLSKENEAKLKEEQAKNVGFIQIMEPARKPAEPSRPSAFNYAVMSLITAFLLGSMLAFLIEYLSAGADKVAEERGGASDPASVGQW